MDTTHPPGWWMFHGDAEHTGCVSGSDISSTTVQDLRLHHELVLDGPILSTPAVVDGHVFVGTANSRSAVGQNGGSFYKVSLDSGRIAAEFHWDIPAQERDSHGFCGMGCTPAVRDGRVIFSAFNGKLYCLDQGDLSLKWVVDLRYADPLHKQPVTNDLGAEQGLPPAAGWSSPCVVGDRVYVGIGEGENPYLYAFVYCLSARTGDVLWIFCTCQYEADRDNRVNELPHDTLSRDPTDPSRPLVPEGYTTFDKPPLVKGCSVWGSIACDEHNGLIYCPTGNPQPDSALKSAGYSNGLLALDAETGRFRAFQQFPPESSYRPTDIDVDVGGSPTVYTDPDTAERVVSLGCKNGSIMVMRADTLEIIRWRQLLPLHRDKTQVETVDVHAPSWVLNQAVMNPSVPNDISNTYQGENYSGTYSTAALHLATKRLFIGVGGNNYHPLAPGIDTPTTPFMRALRTSDLEDAWELDGGDPQRYVRCRPPMYTTEKESGLALPAVANDVVFMTTSRLALYAFAVDDGRLLWQDLLGAETGGMNGGYGYCLGPAIYRNYVVTGSLLMGKSPSSLRIYRLPERDQ